MNLTEQEGWEKNHTTHLSKVILFDIYLPMKFCFDAMEKNPGKQYLFWDPDHQFLLGDNFQTDLQEINLNKQDKDFRNCKFWYFIVKKISRILKPKSEVFDMSGDNDTLAKVIRTYQRWFDKTDQSKKSCNEKLSYFWLFLQFQRRIRRYFNK